MTTTIFRPIARLVLTAGILMLAATSAHAQGASSTNGTSGAGGADERGFVEGIAQSAFGHVVSQSYGGSLGYHTMWPGVSIFVEGGRVTDATSAATSAAAEIIASQPTLQSAGSVTYSVKAPVTFGLAGLRYQLSVGSRTFEPYLSAAGGVARLQQNVTFAINGTNVTGSLPQYGITLGSDLAGVSTYGMISLGAGVIIPLGPVFMADVQYRFDRIYAGTGININRVGAGIGVRF